MPKKTGLGKGLDALIPQRNQFEFNTAIAARSITELPIEDISPNPRQPRSHNDPQALAELAESIRQHGVIQPLVVTHSPQPGKYLLIAGERRFLAAQQAGFSQVPAVIRDVNDQEMIELALVENVQRADLNPLEAAEAYRQLVEDFNLSHEEVAARVGKSRAVVTNTLRLLKLSGEVQRALVETKISEGHARALLALSSPQAQVAALQTVLKNELNVRQTEELVRKLSGHLTTSLPKPARSPEIVDLESRLREYLGTRVNLNRRGKTGTLVIHFYSDEELNAIINTILGG
jgi:ParB family chromosome partitioning protein